MKLYIHSAGRATVSQQGTLRSFPQHIRKGVSLVVQHRERDAYAPVAKELGTKLLVLPPDIKKLSPTRQWLLENAEKDRFAMMDDDLWFARRLENGTNFRKLFLTEPQGAEYIEQMLNDVDALLDTYIHAGILDRGGANRITEMPTMMKRMTRFLAYRKKKVLATGARFDRLVTKQDFDMTLQLLRAGHQNALITNYVQDQINSTNSKGGCSTYRSQEVSDRAAYALAKLHPAYVKVVQRTTKQGWFDKSQPGTRTDVQIQWKRAWEDSQ